jgi:hypothetical protein
MRKYIIPPLVKQVCGVLLLTAFSCFSMQAQDSKEKAVPKPVKNTFSSVWLIDNQSVMVPIK